MEINHGPNIHRINSTKTHMSSAIPSYGLVTKRRRGKFTQKTNECHTADNEA